MKVVATILAALFAGLGWGGQAIMENRTRVSVNESRYEAIVRQLERIEDKIDRLIEN